MERFEIFFQGVAFSLDHMEWTGVVVGGTGVGLISGRTVKRLWGSSSDLSTVMDTAFRYNPLLVQGNWKTGTEHQTAGKLPRSNL